MAASSIDRLNIYILGSPFIQWKGENLRINRRNVRALLFFLASQNSPTHRDKLCLLFWPDEPDSNARRNLTRLLTHLRTALPNPASLQTDQDLVSLDQTLIYSDWIEFQTLFPLQSEKIEEYQHGVDLMRGPFLDGFYLPDCPEYEDWVDQERSALENAYLQVLSSLIDHFSACREYNLAVKYAQKYLQTDELAEDIQRTLIKLYALAGERGKALRQYESCVAVFERELGTDLLPETRTLYQAVLHGTLHEIQEDYLSRTQDTWSSRLCLDVPLVGRSAVMNRLRSVYERSKSQGKVVLLSGEPGIGKTRILHDFIAAHQGQCLPLVGSGDRGEALLPYQPLVEAFHSLNLYPHSLAPVWLAEISRLLPEVRQKYPDLPTPISAQGEDARIRLFEAISRFIIAIQNDYGHVLICLDDLQWFDSTSIRWLIHFCRHHLPKVGRILVLGAYRTEDDQKLKDMRSSLDRTGLVEEISLPGLDADGTGVLIGNMVGEETPLPGLAVWMQEATGGNPFFAIETLRALEEQQALFAYIPSLAEFPLPEGVKDAVRMRIDHLDPGARQLLEAGAVLGSAFDFRTLRATAGRGELETASGLESLTRHHLIQAEGAERFRFNHDLVRKSTVAEMSPVRSRILHRRAAFTLEKLGQPSSSLLAHYFENGGEWRKAMHYYRAAAQDASSVYAWQESLILYTRILGLLNFVNKDLSNREDNRERGAILKETAFLNYLLDNFEARDRDLDYLRDLAQKTDDPVLELLHLQQRTRYDRLSGRFQDALDAANKGILLAGKLNNKTDQASLLVSVGFIYFLLGQPDTAIENLELARALTEEINDIGLHGQVIGRIGFIKSLLGQYREALQNIQEARDCQLKIGNTYAADDYMIEIGRWQSCLGMFSESQQTLMSMLEHTRKTQVRSEESHVLLALCGLYIATGKYSEALDMNQQALGILYNVQNQHLTVTAEVAMGVIFFHLGQYTHSRTWLEKSLESARSIHFSPRTAEVLVNLGLLEHASGNMELARKHIEEGIASARQSHYKEVIAAGLAALAVLERESGRLQEALNDIDEALSLSAQIDFPACSMWAHAEASLVFSHLSRLDEALNHIQNAVDLIPVSDQSWVRSEQVYFIYSQILERAGRAEEAIEQRKLADAARQEKAALISDLELRNSFLSVKLQYL